MHSDIPNTREATRHLILEVIPREFEPDPTCGWSSCTSRGTHSDENGHRQVFRPDTEAGQHVVECGERDAKVGHQHVAAGDHAHGVDDWTWTSRGIHCG